MSGFSRFGNFEGQDTPIPKSKSTIFAIKLTNILFIVQFWQQCRVS
jgi:hypothetical protein